VYDEDLPRITEHKIKDDKGKMIKSKNKFLISNCLVAEPESLTPLTRSSASSTSQVKVKLSLYLTKHHAIKTYGGEGIAPRILDLGTRR
jgi:hypothetical protein